MPRHPPLFACLRAVVGRLRSGASDGRLAPCGVIYGMSMPLDGCIAAAGDDIGLGRDERELFQWWLDQELASSLSLYGRKVWEGMSSSWPTGDQQPDATPTRIEFARNGRDTPKVVFSSTIDTAD